MKTSSWALAVLALLLAAPCRAHDDQSGDEKPAASQDAGPCRQDAEKLCPDMHPGDGKFGPCMKEHMADVSAACKEKMRAMKEKAKDKLAEKKE